jgi:hypothetical protein
VDDDRVAHDCTEPADTGSPPAGGGGHKVNTFGVEGAEVLGAAAAAAAATAAAAAAAAAAVAAAEVGAVATAADGTGASSLLPPLVVALMGACKGGQEGVTRKCLDSLPHLIFEGAWSPTQAML